mmetsp:Transcript_39503/g.156868  ORF Transcript_39503/g.156868 Transcript_39503/m.156868 type:complete len:435 (+) Transcript_39503:695-1999(+)|eukprot:CAMPEP_0113962060 /NCGR_PEP_ID=MMETSP0011_2-20120614/5685_1 /TAXON_ID=101924 /ORGANISM="Rhodosorus marinus" /LENGTH=434 /DNA_ID=CAMNT_0000973831 /DNA_START=447 /DNA_END=1751 /DNA_ORIENTATION=- /assembly_acc=CAM_ASM_000156
MSFGKLVRLNRSSEGEINHQTYSYRSRTALVGLLDALAFCLAIVGGIYTKGTSQVLLQQAGLPLIALATGSWGKKRLEFLQIVGSLVIVIGMYAVITQAGVVGSTDTYTSPWNPVLFNSLFVLSTVPATIANTLRQQILSEECNVDMMSWYAWKSFAQLLFGFLLVPMNMWTKSVSLPNGVIHRSLEAPNCGGLYRAFGALACRIYEASVQPTQYLHYLPPCADCTDSGESLPLFIVFSLLQSFAALMLFCEAPAGVPYLTSVVRIPLVVGCFSLVAGEGLSGAEIPGFMLVMLGVLLFRAEFTPDSARFAAGFKYVSAPFLGPGVNEAFACQIERNEAEQSLPVRSPAPTVDSKKQFFSCNSAQETGKPKPSREGTPLRNVQVPRRYGSCESGEDRGLSYSPSPLSRITPFTAPVSSRCLESEVGEGTVEDPE